MTSWVKAIAGALGAVLGVVLAVRPFASVSLLLLALGIGLIVSGIVEMLQRGESARRERSYGRWNRVLLSVLLVATGVFVLVFPGAGLRVTVAVGAVLLLVGGLRDLLSGLIGKEHRIANLLGGTASLVFGVLALSWRDITVLAFGLIFGVWLALRGGRLLLDAVGEFRGVARPRERSPRQWPRIAWGAVSLVLAVALAALGNKLAGTPRPDEFYALPADVPSAAGTLLRAEPFTRAMPDGASAWRILYTTTRDEGVPAVASGLVVVPDDIDQPPIIAWDHGTTGAAVGCAPTLLPDPLASGAMPDPAAVIAAGWAIVATDYIGLGADSPHEYLVGQPVGRATLDAVRAARQLMGVSLGGQVAVWGHSQGGGAALWTGGLAASYAPEIDVVGVAAMAPAANLPAMIDELANEKAGTLVGPLALAGFAERYDDVRVTDYLRPAATLLYEETLARCWSDPAMLVSVAQAVVIDRPIWSRSPNEGPLSQRLEENVPRLPIAAPLMIAQGLADTLVLPDAQGTYVDELCAAGQKVDYRTFDGEDHVSVVSAGSPLLDELVQWTTDRFAGAPATDTCR